jgi:putative peptidoglycan lipid II flippase
MAINLAGNLILIPLLGRFGFGHVGPPLATAVSSTVNVWMLWTVLKRRGHFETDARLRRRAPRMALAAALMGIALFFLTPLVDPYLTRSLMVRVAALSALVGGGAAIYFLACFATRAFALSDLKALARRG